MLSRASCQCFRKHFWELSSLHAFVSYNGHHEDAKEKRRSAGDGGDAKQEAFASTAERDRAEGSAGALEREEEDSVSVT